MQSMIVVIHYFGPVRERVGRASEELELPEGSTVADVLNQLRRTHASLSALIDSCRLAVDQRYASANDIVPKGSELALIPPVAGG